MSTTTQILFNSPALHSLKREQLVKLCKIHSIKATGKNIELIDKLKRHAQTLPKDSPLSIAARSESTGFVSCPPQDDQTDEEAAPQEGNTTASQFSMPRPSEQWEVVMESIQELEESSSQGTLSSLRTLGSNNGGAGEFGTGNSKCAYLFPHSYAPATHPFFVPSNNYEFLYQSTGHLTWPEAHQCLQTRPSFDHFFQI